jgi:NIPSNAP protein
MLHELRIYTCIPGRLPALLKRFESVTLDMFAKHGIRPAGFWTVQIGEGNNDLHYFLAWESLGERETKWAAFQADPAWISARAESERDGPIVASIKSMILQPTAFSTVK